MKQDNKKLWYVVIALGALCLVGLGVYLVVTIYSGMPQNDQALYEERWSIVLPDDLQEERRAKSPLGPHGERKRLTVYQTGAADDPFYRDFSQQPNVDLQESVTEILSSLEVSADALPSFEAGYAWKTLRQGQDSIYFLLSADRTRLLVVEWIF